MRALNSRMLKAVIAFGILIGAIISAASQDRSSSTQRCLSIPDVNKRIECFETGVVPDTNPVSESNSSLARQAGPSPSFDCRSVRTSVEKTICADVVLSELDGKMGRLFQQTMRLGRDGSAILEGQRLWMSQRDGRCTSLTEGAMKSCISEMTKLRTATLTTMIGPAGPGPTAEPQAERPAQRAPQRAEPTPTVRTDGPAVSSSIAPKPSGMPNDPPQAKESFDFGWLIAVAVALVVAWSILRRILRRRRLVEKYGEVIADRIVAKQVWQGMTEEQLVESLGRPVDIGREVMRSRTKETWKYRQTGKNRFSVRVYLENGIVEGWKH